MAVNFKELKSQCEVWLREGHGEKVGRALNDLGLRSIPRSERLPLAHLARRASLIVLGLKILSPVIYSEQSVPSATRVPPTPGEWAEYGVLLQRIGLADEALKALRHAQGTAEASLYMAFCHFNRWDLASALPHLTNYLDSKNLTEYQRCVGWVNVIAALTSLQRADEARTHLGEWLPFARAKKFSRLTANLLEQCAQLDLLDKNYDGARKSLSEAAKLLEEGHTYDRLFIDKWRAAIELAQYGDESQILKIKARAVENFDWESVRGCDLIRLRYKGSQELFDHLYLGSPFPEFRRSVAAEAAGRFEIPHKIVLGTGERLFDLETGELDGKRVFGRGQVPHKLLKAMFKDFYRPLSTMGLYSMLNPLEHLNIFTAPNLTHQHLHRLRAALERADVPVIIKTENGFFRPVLGRGCAVQIENSQSAPLELPLRKLRQAFGVGLFSPIEARATLNSSPSTMGRIIKRGLEGGNLIQNGAGSKTRYRFAA